MRQAVVSKLAALGLAASVPATLGLAALGLAGCAAPAARTDVVVFHDWPVDARRTYRLELTPAQRGSPEQTAYAQDLRSELAAIGFVPQAGGRFVISFDTTLRQRRTTLRDAPAFYGSYWYGGTGVGGGSAGPPIRGEGAATEVTRLDRELKLVIEDTSRTPPRRVYEATAFADGASADQGPAFTQLARAMLQQFPGPSGTTRHVVADESAPSR